MLLTAIALGVALAGCSSSSTPTPTSQSWRAGHPNPPGMTFSDAAPGLCAITVRYPDEAPATIDFQGITYVQGEMSNRLAQPPGTVVGQSGDWVISAANSKLYLLTTTAMFSYRPASSC